MSKSKPLVTVAITTYNYGQFLKDAIESVLLQTYPNIEILVLNDGSTDDTDEVVKPYLGRVTYISHSNLGLPANRNIGLKMARGEYWLSLDADDTLVPTHLEKTVAFLEKHRKLSYVYTYIQYFGDFRFTAEPQAFNLDELKTHNYISATALTRMSILKENGYDEQFRKGWEDWDLYLSLAEKNHLGEVLPEPLLNYRQHGGSREDTINALSLHSELLEMILTKHKNFYSEAARKKTRAHWQQEGIQQVMAQRAKKQDLSRRLSQLITIVRLHANLKQVVYQAVYTILPCSYAKLKSRRQPL